MKGQYPIEETCSELTFSFWHALKVLYQIWFFSCIQKSIFTYRKK